METEWSFREEKQHVQRPWGGQELAFTPEIRIYMGVKEAGMLRG